MVFFILPAIALWPVTAVTAAVFGEYKNNSDSIHSTIFSHSHSRAVYTPGY